MKKVMFFSEVGLQDVPLVGGKNASLGEMYNSLNPRGIQVPNGFAITAAGYWELLEQNGLIQPLASVLRELDVQDFTNLSQVGQKARQLILNARFPSSLQNEIIAAYRKLELQGGSDQAFAVRSSATAEDLPNASFAGQQETYLNVRGEANLIKACHRCYASLFTDRAIQYRVHNGFDHMKVALSIGVQCMIRSDQACSGVMFTLDPDSGFEHVVLVTGSWGLGENVVQGAVNTDEFLVFKPLISTARQVVISHKLGSKKKTMVYAANTSHEMRSPQDAVVNIDTPFDQQNQFVLKDEEVKKLAEWAIVIQDFYHRHMDIEWAKDGRDGELYVVQARPETVHSKKSKNTWKEYSLRREGRLLCKGAGLGNKIVAGKARLLKSPSELDRIETGEILVTEKTDPDWDPILRKAAAIITDQGGRTSHAAIVAREVGAIAVVGTGNGTQSIYDGQVITVSTASGNTGLVYDDMLDWDEKEIDISSIPETRTKAMLILAHPDEAFQHSFLPNSGVGLMRMEFIISNAIGIHPMALRHFDQIHDIKVRENIETITSHYKVKEEYFIDKLAEATARMAAAFYPKDVIVRMSDFKSNEYANLLGGKYFEPEEENPMIGFRGASRYYHPKFKEAFEMECKAMKRVRDEMGFANVKLMIPFCRTIDEAKRTIQAMADVGLKRGSNGLEIYVMIEIPSNAILAGEFAQYFDGFSIGSNDLTQLTLGADRDSALLSEIFSPFDPAVMQLIEMTLSAAHKRGTHTGLCGQAPSDYPEYAKFLVKNGIDSISFNPDALLKGIEYIHQAEIEMLVAG